MSQSSEIAIEVCDQKMWSVGLYKEIRRERGWWGGVDQCCLVTVLSHKATDGAEHQNESAAICQGGQQHGCSHDLGG